MPRGAAILLDFIRERQAGRAIETIFLKLAFSQPRSAHTGNESFPSQYKKSSQRFLEVQEQRWLFAFRTWGLATKK
ncbi:hypothetical protein I6F15_28280 [Bradyrhizobium sp. BRP14]|nr:hypothetical protein [Bradyrhizobium sp. BRP14]